MVWENEQNQTFLRAILSLDSKKEAKSFLRDVMTEEEINQFGKRLKAAQMLMDDISYTKIQEETGLSSTTVARVAGWLENGCGGYEKVVSSLHHHNPIQTRRGLS